MSQKSPAKTTADPFQDYKVRFRAGEKIFSQGDVGTEMYIVRSGSVRIFRERSGRREALSVLERGDFFGEMAVLEGIPRTDSAEAAEDAELIRIHSAIFDRMIRRNTEIAVRMILKLSRRVEEAAAAAAVAPPVVGGDTARLPAVPVTPGTPVQQVAEAHPERRAVLVLEGGKRSFAVQSESALIGRYDPVTGDRPEIDLTSVDVGRSVSRRHARLLFRDGAYFLTEEVGALNGTFVMDRKVSSGMEIPLEDGDTIKVGRVHLSFRKEAAGS